MRLIAILSAALLTAAALYAESDKGIAAFFAGDFEQAVRELEGAVQADPDNSRAHYYLGLSLGQVGRVAGWGFVSRAQCAKSRLRA